MIFIKNKIKRILSLLVCALIIVSALPISASAASSFQVNFGLNYNAYDGLTDYDSEIQQAISNDIAIFVEEPQGGGGISYTGTAKSFTISGDPSTEITIENSSAFDFRFTLTVPGGYSFGDFTIPASDGVNPGVYIVKLSYIYASAPSATAISFWFRTALTPVPRYNTNYANINIYTGSTLYRTQKVYAPQQILGSYTDSLYNFNRSGLANIPDELNGYKFDWQDYGQISITVDPDVVNTYNVYYDLRVNYSYAILYAVTPNGRQEISRLYAPSGFIGDYVFDVHDLSQDDSIIPTYVDGYTFNHTVSPEYVTVYSDRVVEYDLYYTDIGADKTININYYDQNGKVINQVEYRVSSLGSSFKVPSQKGYLFAPSSVPLTLGLLSESFDVYMIDFVGEREQSYQDGYNDASLEYQKKIEILTEEAYEKGKQDGLSQNTLLQNQKKDLMRDYNVFTAFFDGLFSGLLNAASYLFDGISFGGITLGSVISAITVAIVVFFIVKRLF